MKPHLQDDPKEKEFLEQFAEDFFSGKIVLQDNRPLSSLSPEAILVRESIADLQKIHAQSIILKLPHSVIKKAQKKAGSKDVHEFLVSYLSESL